MTTKNYVLGVLTIAFALLLVGCTGNTKQGKNTSDAKEVKTTTDGIVYTIDNNQSTVLWKGSKPIGSGHNGSLNVSAGEVTINGNKIISGNFTLDLNSIICTDLEGEMAQKLVGHLKSEDFFDAEKFPTGEFVITSATAIENTPDSTLISGNLKLKGIEKNISFKTHISKIENTFTARTETFYIDRTEWGVNYNSKNIFKNLKDGFINDEIEIQIVIQANPKKNL